MHINKTVIKQYFIGRKHVKRMFVMVSKRNFNLKKNK